MKKIMEKQYKITIKNNIKKSTEKKCRMKIIIE